MKIFSISLVVGGRNYRFMLRNIFIYRYGRNYSYACFYINLDINMVQIIAMLLYINLVIDMVTYGINYSKDSTSRGRSTYMGKLVAAPPLRPEQKVNIEWTVLVNVESLIISMLLYINLVIDMVQIIALCMFILI